jgi:hypothetical protein
MMTGSLRLVQDHVDSTTASLQKQLRVLRELPQLPAEAIAEPPRPSQLSGDEDGTETDTSSSTDMSSDSSVESW